MFTDNIEVIFVTCVINFYEHLVESDAKKKKTKQFSAYILHLNLTDAFSLITVVHLLSIDLIQSPKHMRQHVVSFQT